MIFSVPDLVSLLLRKGGGEWREERGGALCKWLGKENHKMKRIRWVGGNEETRHSAIYKCAWESGKEKFST